MEFANGGAVGRRTMMTVWFLLLVAPGAMGANELNWEAFNNSIFDRSNVVGTDIELMTGPMIYQEEADKNFTEGYRPESSRELAGARKQREVYDLPQVWGATGVFSWTLARLEEAGFETVFQCEESDCGDVAAWKLYLSDLVAGEKKGQHYVLARTNNEPGWSTWVAVYVNEFDGQTRLILDHVIPSQANWLEKHFLSGSTIHFSPGEAKADDSALANLGRAVDEVASLEDAKFLILGSADAKGALVMNVWLSGLRARNVRDYLVKRDFLSADNLIVKPFSSLVPRENNGSPNGRQKNRRVEVLIVN